MLLGIFASLIGGLIGGTSFWYYLVAAICFVIGLQMMGILNLQLPMWLGGLRERVGLRAYRAGQPDLGMARRDHPQSRDSPTSNADGRVQTPAANQL